MRDYYADFLQTKNSVNTLPTEVSKVSKGQNLVKKLPFDTFDTAFPSIIPEIYVPKNNDELAEYKTEKFHEVLNRFIEKGISFDVSADDFQIIDSNQKLKTSDREFLKLNGAAILCQLQQSLLMKHLFSHSPEQFEDFAFEITERESLLTITDKTPFEIYLFAVKDVTKKWFEDLLNKKQFELVRLWKAQIIKELSPKCSNCTLAMELIENGKLWFCPLGCESKERHSAVRLNK